MQMIYIYNIHGYNGSWFSQLGFSIAIDPAVHCEGVFRVWFTGWIASTISGLSHPYCRIFTFSDTVTDTFRATFSTWISSSSIEVIELDGPCNVYIYIHSVKWSIFFLVTHGHIPMMFSWYFPVSRVMITTIPGSHQRASQREPCEALQQQNATDQEWWIARYNLGYKSTEMDTFRII